MAALQASVMEATDEAVQGGGPSDTKKAKGAGDEPQADQVKKRKKPVAPVVQLLANSDRLVAGS